MINIRLDDRNAKYKICKNILYYVIFILKNKQINIKSCTNNEKNI